MFVGVYLWGALHHLVIVLWHCTQPPTVEATYQLFTCLCSTAGPTFNHNHPQEFLPEFLPTERITAHHNAKRTILTIRILTHHTVNILLHYITT